VIPRLITLGELAWIMGVLVSGFPTFRGFDIDWWMTATWPDITQSFPSLWLKKPIIGWPAPRGYAIIDWPTLHNLRIEARKGFIRRQEQIREWEAYRRSEAYRGSHP
jgi:hypothetical protein